ISPSRVKPRNWVNIGLGAEPISLSRQLTRTPPSRPRASPRSRASACSPHDDRRPASTSTLGPPTAVIGKFRLYDTSLSPCSFDIDEAGRFTRGDGISVVCGLSIPHQEAGRCRRELLRISKDWPRRDDELKAAELQTHRLVTLVDVLYRHDSLLHAVALDVSGHPAGVIARHQASQAEGITRNLTDDHYPSLREALWELRRKLEGMPEQLYVQCVAMHQLLS